MTPQEFIALIDRYYLAAVHNMAVLEDMAKADPAAAAETAVTRGNIPTSMAATSHLALEILADWTQDGREPRNLSGLVAAVEKYVELSGYPRPDDQAAFRQADSLLQSLYTTRLQLVSNAESDDD